MSPESAIAYLDCVDFGVLVLGADRNIRVCNRWLAERLKLAALPIGQPLSALSPEPLPGRLLQVVEQALGRGHSGRISSALHPSPLPIFSAGARLRHAVDVVPVAGSTGERECLIQIRDMSESFRREEVLREQALRVQASERRLAGILETAPIGMAVTRADGRWAYVNKALCDILKLPSHALLGRCSASLRRAGTGCCGTTGGTCQCQPGTTEEQWEDAAGVPVWVRVTSTRTCEPDSALPVMIVQVEPIDERKRAEEELRATLRLLGSVLDASTRVAILVTDPQGRIEVFNRGAERLLGRSHGARHRGLKGAPLGDLLDQDELRHFTRQLNERNGRAVAPASALFDADALGETTEWNLRSRGGEPVAVSLTVARRNSEDGQLAGFLVVAHDVSERRRQEASLRDAMNKAHQANQAKSQFLANMSHEIRTPLNAVIGLTYLLQRSELNDEQTDTLSKISTASKALLTIVNDVLDLSKIEAGEMVLEAAPFDPAAIFTELADVMGVAARDKGIRFELALPQAALPQVIGDATRLRQILLNLLSNAIKFTQQGDVRLSLELTHQSATRVGWRICVTDSGIGIPDAAQQRLFAPFVQADSSTTRRFGGTGLGLSIVRQLVELMGGQLGLHSAEGVGSQFWVALDLDVHAGALVAPAQGAQMQRRDLRGVRVLLVDDSPINLEVARRLLEAEGAIVCLANDGEAAVDQVRAAPDDIDLILMDVQMPGLDGLDATRLIRGLETHRRIPIVGLTAGVTVREQQLAKAAGMTEIVGKPFDPPALLRCVQSHVGVAPSAEPAAPQGPRSLEAWPQIEGIDRRDAATRFGGDQALFESTLRQFLALYGRTGPLASELRSPTLGAPLAAACHRLRGAAGTLGALELQDAALQLERLALHGTQDELTHAVHRLALAMRTLEASAEARLPRTGHGLPTQPGSPGSPVSPGLSGPQLDWDELHALRRQLSANDLGALASFDRLRPRLTDCLGAERMSELQLAVHTLDFERLGSALDTIAGALN